MSTALARKAGLHIGDTITVRRGDVHLAVVGLYEWANEVNAEGVITAEPMDPTPQVRTNGTAWVKAPPGTSSGVTRRITSH